MNSSGSYFGHFLFNQCEWFNLTISKYVGVQIPNKEEIQSLVPTGLLLFIHVYNTCS